MTYYDEVFKIFLSKIQKDSTFALYSEMELEEDMIDILNTAIPHFKYPRENLMLKDDFGAYFEEDLKLDTIAVLTDYMKYEWYVRKAANTDTLDQRVATKDLVFYSQSSHVTALGKMVDQAFTIAQKSEERYYRTMSGRPQIVGLVGDER